MRRSLLVLVVAVACAGCTSSSHGAPGIVPSASRGQSGQLTAAELKDRLLRKSDLTYYLPYKPQADYPTSTSNPRCLEAADDLDGFFAPAPPATQAWTDFAQSKNGPWLEEVLRSYPAGQAAAVFSRTTGLLGQCGRFTVKWTVPPAARTEAISSLPFPALGEQSWAASVKVSGGDTPVTAIIDLVRTGQTIVEVNVASAIAEPTPAQVKAIAAEAVAKLSR